MQVFKFCVWCRIRRSLLSLLRLALDRFFGKQSGLDTPIVWETQRYRYQLDWFAKDSVSGGQLELPLGEEKKDKTRSSPLKKRSEKESFARSRSRHSV